MMCQAAKRALKGLTKKIDILCKRVYVMEGAITTLQDEIRKLKEQRYMQYESSSFVDEVVAPHRTPLDPIDAMLNQIGVNLNEAGKVVKSETEEQVM